jgi:predicted peptidase
MAMTRTDHVFGVIPYIKYVPSDITQIKGVILYLHGAGEIGTVLSDLEANEIPKLFKSPSVIEKNYIVICPQLAPPATGWSATNIKYLLELIERTSYEYQNTNIILTGLSLGGYTALLLIREAYLKYGHDHFFTAAGLMCAKILNSTTFDVTPYLGTPIKLWHGTTDTINPISTMRNFRTRVNAGGGDVTLVEYAGVAHDVWSLPRGYADANFWAFADTYGAVQSGDCDAEVAAATAAGIATGTAAGIITGTATGRTEMKAEAVAAIAALTP